METHYLLEKHCILTVLFLLQTFAPDLNNVIFLKIDISGAFDYSDSGRGIFLSMSVSLNFTGTKKISAPTSIIITPNFVCFSVFFQYGSDFNTSK